MQKETLSFKKLSSLVAFLMLILITITPVLQVVYAQSIYTQSSERTNTANRCPNYNFTRTISQGSKGEDVKILQQILNLDYRTRIAISGAGSKGSETQLYGVATREAVKRFQALFIELVGVADGKINTKTLTALNAVCKGPYFTGKSTDVYDINSTKPVTTNVNKDSLGPLVTISAPATSLVGESYRLWIYANEAIKTPSVNNFIITGEATLSDIRKENPSTYKLLVTPTKAATNTIRIQLEADTVNDIANNKNENASNEVSTEVSPAPIGPDTVRPTINININSFGIMTISDAGIVDPVTLLFNVSEDIVTSPAISDFVTSGNITISNLRKLDDRTYNFTINSSATSNETASIAFPANILVDRAGNKNTVSNTLSLSILKIVKKVEQSPITSTQPYVSGGSGGGNESSQSGGAMQSLMQLLPVAALLGLNSLLGGGGLSSLTSGLSSSLSGVGSSISGALGGGGTPIGGLITSSGFCVCGGGMPTGFLAAVNGSSGVYVITGVLPGQYTGIKTPPPGLCGKRFPIDGPRYRDPCADAGGQRVGNCCGPLLDSEGKPVIGTLLKVQ